MRSLYSDRRTWLHAVPAGLKLLVIATLGTAFFISGKLPVLVAGTAVVGAAFASLGRSVRPALRLVASIAAASALVAVFHVLAGHPELGAASVLRLMSASLLGVMLTLTTRYDELLDVIETLLRPFGRMGFRTGRLALGIGLMLRYTEHFFVQWRRMDDAYRARSGKSGGFALLAPLTVRMLLTARRVADALAVRLGG
ncbi:energy-coupling factor transporter transmembrane protein EcfT [Candidimonas humi]|uniref:Energy-coupling factor transporter transmembrane component T family protein n=1 Tax=Candidimonas humi TaxID=683355 RepID=A0ABV8P2T2_9BURK|nr:energy-coupling factor transporter transmembrane protein EcfT [Candidimonas humi]